MSRRLWKWAGARTQTPIGLDIGSSAIKLIQLEQRGTRYRLKRFDVCRLESDVMDEEAKAHRLRAVLSDLLQEAELLGSPVAISVSGPSVMVKRIHVSGVREDALEEHLTWEGHQYVSCAMSDVYFDYWPLSPASTEMDVLLVAARQQVVESRTTLLEDIGVHPVVCDVDGLALMKTIMRKSPALRGRSFGIVNVGASGMNLVFATDQDPLVVRDVTFEETRSRRTVDDEPVEETTAPRQEGSPDRPWIVEEVTREVKRCVESLLERHPGFMVDKLFLCGGQAKHPRLQEALQSALAIPALPINPFDEIEWDPDHRLSALAHLGGVAVGLALHRDNHG